MQQAERSLRIEEVDFSESTVDNKKSLSSKGEVKMIGTGATGHLGLPSKQKQTQANAFLTDCLLNQNEDQRPCKKAREVKETGAMIKDRKEREEKLRKCLSFLGVKEFSMLDNYRPQFQKELEDRTVDKLV